MCLSEESLLTMTEEYELRRRKLAHQTSTLATSSETSSDSSASSSQIRVRLLKRSIYDQFASSSKNSTGILSYALILLLAFHGGILLSLATVAFALWFPFVLTPHAATETYVPAAYNYDASLSHFDNTAWTYGTDYGLCVVMFFLAYSCANASSCRKTRRLRYSSAGLLLMYAMSVAAGGWAHQFYTTFPSRNTWHFRLLWTVCVGTVTAAGGWMGAAGSELVSLLFEEGSGVAATASGSSLRPLKLSRRQAFWMGFGFGTTLVCAAGGISYQRPACDIFVAGTSQAPPTFFLMAVVWKSAMSNGAVSRRILNVYRVVCVVGFILNAPLLPLYSLLVQYTNWSLASVNTLLHTWLLVAWTMQGLSLRHFIVSIHRAHEAKASSS